MANDRCTSAPRRTGQADFPHPALLKALALGMHRFAPKLEESAFAQVGREGLSFGNAIGSLAAALQMLPQPVLKVAIEVAKSPAGIPTAEVITPAFEMPVQIANQLSDRPEVLPVTDHLPQSLPFTRHRFCRRVHVQKTVLSAKVVLLKAKGIAQKVQTLPCFAQFHHTGFLTVQFQPKPSFQLFLDELPQASSLITRQ